MSHLHIPPPSFPLSSFLLLPFLPSLPLPPPFLPSLPPSSSSLSFPLSLLPSSSPHLLFPSLRYLYCLQLCRDIRANRVLTDRETATRLSALMLQGTSVSSALSTESYPHVGKLATIQYLNPTHNRWETFKGENFRSFVVLHKMFSL